MGVSVRPSRESELRLWWVTLPVKMFSGHLHVPCGKQIFSGGAPCCACHPRQISKVLSGGSPPAWEERVGTLCFSNQWELCRNFECWSMFFSHYFWCQCSPLKAVPWVTAASGQQNNAGGHQRVFDICWSRTDLKLAGLAFLPTSFSVTMELSGDGVGGPWFCFFKVSFLNFW